MVIPGAIGERVHVDEPTQLLLGRPHLQLKHTYEARARGATEDELTLNHR